MRPTGIRPGHLGARLDTLRQFARARYVALTWRVHGQTWRYHVSGRDAMPPQSRDLFCRQLQAVQFGGTVDSARWRKFLADWRSPGGLYASFPSDAALEGHYCVLFEHRDTEPGFSESVRRWCSVIMPALAEAEESTAAGQDRWSDRQAVHESAAALSSAGSDSEALHHGARLAMRLLGAQGVGVYAVAESGRSITPTFVQGDETLKAWLGRGFPLPAGDMQSLLKGWEESVACNTEELPSHPVLPGGRLLTVPLRRGGTIDHLLCAARAHGTSFSDWDRLSLVLFSRQLAGARDNLYLMQELRAANRELAHAQAQLVEKARLETQSEIAANVAHDFNNVLGALLGRVQLLQHKVADPAAQKALAKMEGMIADGARMIGRLQDAGRVRRVPQHPGTLDGLVRNVYESCAETLRNQAQIHNRRHTWKTRFEPARTFTDPGDRLAAVLRQTLIELAGSAPGTALIELHTEGGGSADVLRLSVAPASDPAAASSWSWESLPSWRQFETVLDQRGAKRSMRTGTQGEHLLEIVFEPDKPSAVPAVSTNPLRILVVDDDADVREVLEELLRIGGHVVTSAADGEQALQLFRESDYDLVITDLGMPGISGWQVAAYVKREAPTTPVVMVTGWGAQLDGERLADSGVDRVLTKPFQWYSVIRTINDVVAR